MQDLWGNASVENINEAVKKGCVLSGKNEGVLSKSEITYLEETEKCSHQ